MPKDSAGQVPRTVEVEVREDMVDSCTAGDVVTVVGIVKVINTEAIPGDLQKKMSTIHNMCCILRKDIYLKMGRDLCAARQVVTRARMQKPCSCSTWTLSP